MPYSVSFREGILFRFNLITNSLIFSDSRTNFYYLNITVKDSSEYFPAFPTWNPKSWPFLGRGDSPKFRDFRGDIFSGEAVAAWRIIPVHPPFLSANEVSYRHLGPDLSRCPTRIFWTKFSITTCANGHQLIPGTLAAVSP